MSVLTAVVASSGVEYVTNAKLCGLFSRTTSCVSTLHGQPGTGANATHTLPARAKRFLISSASTPKATLLTYTYTCQRPVTSRFQLTLQALLSAGAGAGATGAAGASWAAGAAGATSAAAAGAPLGIDSGVVMLHSINNTGVRQSRKRTEPPSSKLSDADARLRRRPNHHVTCLLRPWLGLL